MGFSDKIRVLRAHQFVTKEGAKWNAKAQGFTYVIESADREKLKQINADHPEIGVHKETLRLWEDGEPASVEALKRLCLFVNKYLVVKTRLGVGDFENEVSLDAFCRKLGYSDGENILKEYSGKFVKSGPHADYIYKKEEAVEYTQLNRGLYRGYRKNNMSEIVRFGLVIIGAVPVTSRANERQFAICTALSIPTNDGDTVYLYSGALCCGRHALVSWHFLQEARQRRDYIYMMTGRGGETRLGRQTDGHMLTMTQGQSAASVTYRIVIRKDEKTFISCAEIDEFLRNTATPSPDDVDYEIKEILLDRPSRKPKD